MIPVLKKYVSTLVLIIFFLFLASLVNHFSFAQAETPTPTITPSPTPDTSSQDRQNQLQKEIEELQKKLSELQGQEKTLSSQIAVMDSQIKLTQLRINAVKQQIKDLTEDIETATKKISNLEESLSTLTKVLLNRIVATYEVGNVGPLHVLLASNNISSFFTRANYLRLAQAHDKKLIFATQQAKNDYTNQKEIFEDKKEKVEALKTQLETYTVQLDQEKKAKQSLLDVTKNDEKRYQDLLARARAEFEAIQGIIAGRGQETEIKNVSEGEQIATVISGSSCNSSATHLHFIVSRGGNTENPFNYLKPVDYENCSGSSCGSADGDSFNPSGSWNWPIDPRIKFTQGYGSTWAIKYTWVGQIYNFHNGLDFAGSSYDVKAVRSGKLYQGSYTGYAECSLRYVKVLHEDGLETLYLHVNYVF